MSDALALASRARAPPEHAPRVGARSLIDLARECLEMHGIRAGRTAERNLDARRRLAHDPRFRYSARGRTKQIACARSTKARRAASDPQRDRLRASDFRDIHRLAAGNFPTPFKVLEHAEYTRGSFTESDERYSLATFGRIFGISRQAIINDDWASSRVLTALQASPPPNSSRPRSRIWLSQIP